MSIDENSNESENPNQAETPVEAENETVVTPAAAAPVAAQAEAAKNAAGNALNTLLALKESNPKVFYGGIGGVVVLLLVVMMSGGSDNRLPVHKSTDIVSGQNYVLKGANASDPAATIRLVSVPGSMAAYDDTEEADRVGGCKHMPQGTPVKAIQTQDAYGKKDVFVEVEMTSGECQGKRGWALAINVQ